jgi:hypothetical protein
MSEKIYGLMAEFDSPAAVLHAAEKVRDAGYPPLGRLHAVSGSWPGQGDGLQKFAGRLVCAGVWRRRVHRPSMLMIWFMNDFDYPDSRRRQADVQRADDASCRPISCWCWRRVGAFVGMVALNQFPRLHHPLFKKAL